MDLRFKATATCLAAAISVVLATPAFGAPAGDEYLPKVPKASGQSQSNDEGSAGSADASGSSETATTDSEAQGAVPAGGGGDSGKGEGAQANQGGDPAPTPISSAPASSSDDSSDSSLFSPVAILLVAGVLIAVVGMTLRRRSMEGEQRDQAAGTGRSERGKTPPTPDGEIIAGGDRPS
jgi:hypothetical protein